MAPQGYIPAPQYYQTTAQASYMQAQQQPLIYQGQQQQPNVYASPQQPLQIVNPN